MVSPTAEGEHSNAPAVTPGAPTPATMFAGLSMVRRTPRSLSSRPSPTGPAVSPRGTCPHRPLLSASLALQGELTCAFLLQGDLTEGCGAPATGRARQPQGDALAGGGGPAAAGGAGRPAALRQPIAGRRAAPCRCDFRGF